ncbi:cystic fibrosis transmembrane conductance regulator [Plakobranchus ocellatus]|uniref:Cystic fibrosis transmembrane conductance regulator n=1 Tax=Plakobranchus ocellatus TaxID=259542 RepID=A0AAV3ZSN2_9GAST|nr:cystic fibrosis transmembrane conductance regulator [Plakobranchus ocellatus]
MDESLRHVNPNPTTKANFLSQTFFCWLNPLFKKGYKRSLEDTDLYNVCPEDASDYLGEKLKTEWDKQLERQERGKEPSLLRALAATFGLQYMLLGIVVFLEEGTKVVQPLLLGGLIRYFTPNSTTTRAEAWGYASGVSLCAIVLAVVHHPYFFCVQRIGMRMRIACCSLMYKKCLRLSNKALNESSVGQIVNLMSNDVNRFDQAVIFLHFLWVGPLQALAVLIILWYELGPSVLAGFLVLVLLIPVQGFMGKLFSKLRQKTAVHTDERVKVMNEIISGMRVIKMYCWEKPFGQLVEKIRGLEIAQLRDTRRAQSTILVPYFIASKLALMLVFTSLTVSGADGRMNAHAVFLTMGLLQALRLSCTLFIPFAFQHMAEVRIVYRRLQVTLKLCVTVSSILCLHIIFSRPYPPFSALQKIRSEIKHVKVARLLQGAFFLPHFIVIASCMLATFGTLLIVQSLFGSTEDASEAAAGGDGSFESPMSPRRVFLAYGLFGALRIPLTIFIPFTVQYIAEIWVVGFRVEGILDGNIFPMFHAKTGSILPSRIPYVFTLRQGEYYPLDNKNKIIHLIKDPIRLYSKSAKKATVYFYLESSTSLRKDSKRSEIKHVKVARLLQGAFYVPLFILIASCMLATFGTLLIVQSLFRSTEDASEAAASGDGSLESPMSPRRVFLAYGLFSALRVPITLFIPFSVQYIAEMWVVGFRIEVRRSLKLIEVYGGKKRPLFDLLFTF